MKKIENEEIAASRPRQTSAVDGRVGRNLKNLRLQAGHSQEEVGKILGVSFQQVQKYENGLTRVPLGMLLKLKYHYRVSWDSLFAGLPGTPLPDTDGFDEQTMRLCRRISAIRDPGLRRKIGKIIEILDS